MTQRANPAGRRISNSQRASNPEPVAHEQLQPIQPMSNTPRTPIRLLIVDDDEQLRHTLVAPLRAPGHGGVQRRQRRGGPGRSRPTPRFDVALLDLHLPGMSGIELLEKLKERQPDLEAPAADRPRQHRDGHARP